MPKISKFQAWALAAILIILLPLPIHSAPTYQILAKSQSAP